MRALILKDIASLKKTLLLTIGISILISVYGIRENSIFMIPLLCIMIPLILTAIAFGYDVKSNFEQFAFSMPIKKSSYVISKLFFSICFGVIGTIALCFLLAHNSNLPLKDIVLISILYLIVSLLISAIQLPFILKYGAEKGRLIMVLTYFLIFGLTSLLKDKTFMLLDIFKNDAKNSLLLTYMGFIIGGILLITLFVKISIGIMQKKEY